MVFQPASRVEARASDEVRHRDLEFLGETRKQLVNILTEFNVGRGVLYVGEIGGSLRRQVNGGAKFEK